MSWIHAIDAATARKLAAEFGTPVYLYDESSLRARAREAMALPAPFGLTVRYAMKAAPTRAILRIFLDEGLHFDASSGYEAERAIAAGVPAERISLSTQELPGNFAHLLAAGVSINACSLSQIRAIGAAAPGSRIGLRFNPGLGSGSTNRTNVGGPASSFGIWHAYAAEAANLAAKYQLEVFRIHSHIGSGSDPEVWKRVLELNLNLVRDFPSVTHLNLGGGYKVARMPGEKATDLQQIGEPMAQILSRFAAASGRQLHFEIEPGTFLVANAGAILCAVQDVVDTGEGGYTFYKLDTGMTEILRPSLYGAQHPIRILAADPAAQRDVIVVGHCCESGDILTPAPGDPEALLPRRLPLAAIGDLALIGGAGAYCSGMSAKNYNSFPEAPEVLLCTDGTAVCIRQRQTLAQICANELNLPG